MNRRVLSGVAAGVLLFGLSGCSGDDGATAASTKYGDISMAELAAAVADVQQAQGSPTTQPVVGMSVANLQRMLQDILIDAKAKELKIKVSDAAVKKAVKELAAQNGGEDALKQAALQGGIGPGAIEDVVRANLLVNEIGLKLDNPGTNDERLLAAQTALTKLSGGADVQVAPRFGIWDDATLSISDLSVTSSLAPTAEATDSATPQPTDAASPVATPAQ